MTRIDPCVGCGGPYPSFHICVVRTDVVKPKLNKKTNAGLTFDDNMVTWVEEQLRAISRNQTIINVYKTGTVTSDETAHLVGVTTGVAYRVLREAADRGEIEMRKRGKYPKKEVEYDDDLVG